MTVAFTFPGQGSQSVGMGKALAEDFTAARLVFEEVNDALGEKLSHTIWEGPEDALQLTANTQPALMAVSLAVVRVLEAEGLDLKMDTRFVAGHSLGEYSALCAAGTFSLGDTARLLRVRGNAMQDAVPVGKGAMAAIIGLSFEDVEALCKKASTLGVCEIANDNGGGQVVISGEKEPVEKAVVIANEMGAKRALLLSVSAPFHSSLMRPAAFAMEEALADVRKSTPVVPVIANVRAEPVTDPEEISKLLVEQVTGRVRWREIVSWFAENEVETLYEIGAGKVLSGLARRIDRTLNTAAIGAPADIDGLLKTIKG